MNQDTLLALYSSSDFMLWQTQQSYKNITKETILSRFN